MTVRITAFVLVLFAFPSANAADLVMSCPSATVGAPLNSCLTLQWSESRSDTKVASCLSTCTWNSLDSQWRTFGTLPADAKVLRCTKDIPADVSFRAGSGVDPCPPEAKTWALANASLIVRTASWRAPTSREDNTPLLDLAGYRLSVAERETGPWRLVAVPQATSAEMRVQVSVSALERCAQLVARTGAGEESQPRTVCLKLAPPGAVDDFRFE